MPRELKSSDERQAECMTFVNCALTLIGVAACALALAAVFH